jgi:FMN-dependent NADH-azoreductase
MIKTSIKLIIQRDVMKNILVINTSARTQDSLSRKLTAHILLKIKKDQDKVINRDLLNEMYFLNNTDKEVINKASKQDTNNLQDNLIHELENADVIVIGMPIYNFSVPASFKAWADLVAKAKVTFKYTENGPVGLLNNKKVYLAIVSGGTKVNSDMDFATPWTKYFLNFIGLSNISLIKADGIYQQDGEKSLEEAYEQVNKL